jgi:hypothetical protein
MQLLVIDFKSFWTGIWQIVLIEVKRRGDVPLRKRSIELADTQDQRRCQRPHFLVFGIVWRCNGSEANRCVECCLTY